MRPLLRLKKAFPQLSGLYAKIMRTTGRADWLGTEVKMHNPITFSQVLEGYLLYADARRLSPHISLPEFSPGPGASPIISSGFSQPPSRCSIRSKPNALSQPIRCMPRRQDFSTSQTSRSILPFLERSQSSPTSCSSIDGFAERAARPETGTRWPLETRSIGRDHPWRSHFESHPAGRTRLPVRTSWQLHLHQRMSA